jgi:putative Mn2+ efflux pump MntP
MNLSLLFFVNSAALGAGLAMDAFSVSIANGLREPDMKKERMFLIAGTFALFQFMMPLLGWVCVHTVVTYFRIFEKAIPWIALILLSFIGGNMLKDAFSKEKTEEEELGGGTLIMQGIATSIDALSVGFTIAEYNLSEALIASLIIGIVTFAICMFGLLSGRKVGSRISEKANIFGGVILIVIGLEIFITSFI